MNVERITELRNLIAGLPKEDFDMRWFAINECGSPACIGGWAHRLFGKGRGYAGNLAYHLGELLELDTYRARKLFLPVFIQVDYKDVTSQQAAETLKKLLETGEVDWQHVGETIEE